MENFDHTKANDSYNKKRFSWRQSRDCTDGSDEIKRANDVYLPIPSGFLMNDSSYDIQGSGNNKSGDYSKMYLPWWHQNPMYRSYLQRAKFPEISANTLRGLVGIATKQEPQIKLASGISYLKNNATPDGLSLAELYEFVISEILQTGKISLVVDVKENGEFYISPYNAESNLNWKVENQGGEKVQTIGTFVEKDLEDENKNVYFVYSFDDAGIAVFEKFRGNESQGTAEPVARKGKILKRLPIVNLGAINKSPEPDIVPMQGINEISISIYRKDADLSQAQFLTCNPTLFIFGVQQNELPKVIGSSVAVGISNPNGRAEYPSTDTSALDHVENAKRNLFDEAIYYGASLLGTSKKGVESADSLALREAANGASLIGVVRQAYKGIQGALDIIESLGGGKSEFVGATDFAEHSLTPQGLNSLVSSWIQGAFSQDTLLDKLRESNIVSNEITNEQEKDKILKDQEEAFLISEERMPEQLKEGEGDKDKDKDKEKKEKKEVEK